MADQALLFGRVIFRQGNYAAIMARHANFFHFFPALPPFYGIDKGPVLFVRWDFAWVITAGLYQEDRKDHPDNGHKAPVAFSQFHIITPCMPFIAKEEKMRPAEAFPVR